MRIALYITAALALASVATASAGTFTGMAQSPMPCGNSTKACRDLPHHQAWLINDGAVSYGPVPIGSGKRALQL